MISVMIRNIRHDDCSAYETHLETLNDLNVTSVPLYRQIANYGGQPTKIGFIDWQDWSGLDNLLSSGSHENPVGVDDLPELLIYSKFRAGDGIVVQHNVVNEYNLPLHEDEVAEDEAVLPHHRWESVYSLLPNGGPENFPGEPHTIYDSRNWRMYFPPDQLTKAVKWVNEQLRKPMSPIIPSRPVSPINPHQL